MCGISGIGVNRRLTPESIEFIKRAIPSLLLSSKERGEDATGVVIINKIQEKDRKSEAVLCKANLDADEFIKAEEYKNALKRICKSTKIILMHCRKSTVGSPENPLNNHPIYIEEKGLFGVHNGSITDHEKIRTTKVKGIAKKGDVDSEVLFAYLASKSKGTLSADDIREVYKDTLGGRSIAFTLAREPDILYLARNSMTSQKIWYTYNDLLGLFFFAQEKEYIEKLGLKDVKEFEDMRIGRVVLRNTNNPLRIVPINETSVHQKFANATKTEFDKTANAALSQLKGKKAFLEGARFIVDEIRKELFI